MADGIDETLETARRLGVEADEAETREWLLAVAAGGGGKVEADFEDGVFGDRVALLDFDTDHLEHLRRLVRHVRLEPRPELASAIAISGSSAQGRVQLFPGDKDFFERAHLRASSREEATQLLREVMRASALRALSEPDIVLVEVNLGVYPEPVRERGAAKGAGDPITWAPDDIERGAITVEREAGGSLTLAWDDVDVANGWVYLGWIVADRDAGRIALASNMVDATWEGPDGVIQSLDGAVDPLAQEIYLEASSLPLVERLGREVAPGARDAYREAMRSEVRHYTHDDPSFAKAAKRLYNLFRVADELEAAAYVRELFDEPTARLYQVPGLLEAADLALDPESGIDRAMVLEQIAVVRDAIAEATDGPEETRLLADLQELEDAALREGRESDEWATVLAEVRSRCAALVNEFFRTRLLAHDRVREIIDDLARE
jgi:hypothetical protein